MGPDLQCGPVHPGWSRPPPVIAAAGSGSAGGVWSVVLRNHTL